MSLKVWEIIDAVFVIIMGTLLHFVYGWSGNNPVVGVFGSINESTWEHLKLLFWPAVFFSIFEYFMIGKDYTCFITAKTIAIFVGIAIIPMLFYTYKGIIGKDYLVLDILVFVIGVLVYVYITYKFTMEKICAGNSAGGSLVFLIALALCFIVFTFEPPYIALFQDPITNGYGISNHVKLPS